MKHNPCGEWNQLLLLYWCKKNCLVLMEACACLVCSSWFIYLSAPVRQLSAVQPHFLFSSSPKSWCAEPIRRVTSFLVVLMRVRCSFLHLNLFDVCMTIDQTHAHLQCATVKLCIRFMSLAPARHQELGALGRTWLFSSIGQLEDIQLLNGGHVLMVWRHQCQTAPSP